MRLAHLRACRAREHAPKQAGGGHQKTVTTSGTPIYSVEYDTPTAPRDQLGRVQQKLETVEGTARLEEYGYDVRGRLTDTTVDGVAVFHQEYDDNGNRLSRSGPGGTEEGVYDDQDRVESYGSYVFTWGANGEIESKTDTGTGDEWLFEYDALGNLLRVDLPDGRVIEYLVDGVGRRVGKKVDGVLVKQWLYRDTLKPVAELDGAGVLQARFVYGTSEVVPDYVVKSGSTYRVIFDQLGSPRLVVNVSTGAVAQRMRHDEWGRVVEDTNPGWGPFGFSGGIYDPDTGLVRFGARDYDPSVGRWVSKDPIRFDGGINLYAYAEDDPVNLTDPSGNGPACDACRACLAAASFAVLRCVAAARTPAALAVCNLIRIGCVPGCLIAAATEGCFLGPPNESSQPGECEGRSGRDEPDGGAGGAPHR